MSSHLSFTVACAVALLAVPAGSMAQGADRNHDGLPDRWEGRHHLSLKVNQATRDPDHDGLNNRGERRHGTDPRSADTDGDGLPDGLEVRTGNDPRKRDSDGDGVADGRENAGAVQSFNGGVLTIKLADGSTLSGTVSDATRVSCQHADETEIESETTVHHRRAATANAARNGGDSGPGSGHDNNEAENENEHAAENEVGEHHSAPDSTCAAKGLVPGAAVHEASLRATAAGSLFEAVELVR